MSRRWKDEFNDDGTRKCDSELERSRDRSNGTAERNIRERDDARWGRGKCAGKTGNPFVDNPFFNPWAPGGSFNKKG